MASPDFMILSKLMSYVFTLLGVVIVLRSFRWLHKDRRATNRRLKALPDAGTIGVLTVLQGSSELPEGTIIPVPPEGVLGFLRTCDVVVPVDNVIGQHLDFTFRNGKGLFIYPRRGCPTTVDGVTLDSRSDSHRYPMQHGSVLTIGDAVLQLGVFAGLDVDHFNGVWQSPSGYDEEPYVPDLWSERQPPLPPQKDDPDDAAPQPLYQPFRQSGGYPAQSPGPMPPYAPPIAPMPPQYGPGSYPPPSGMPYGTPLTPPQRRPDDEA